MGLAFAIAGTPPFSVFFAEWNILTIAIDGRHFIVAIVLLASLTLAFIAILSHFSGMMFGKPNRAQAKIGENRISTAGLVFAPAILIVCSVILGLTLTPAVMAIAGGLTR
jgi:formate hydrogenlyase subunit 3/multisubunit Na+/H+ antiporter MnhD subunit